MICTDASNIATGACLFGCSKSVQAIISEPDVFVSDPGRALNASSFMFSMKLKGNGSLSRAKATP